MHYFLPQIKSYIKPNFRILEIGPGQGLVSQELLDSFPDIKLEIVGPFSLDNNVIVEKFGTNPRVTLHNGLSLDILPELLWQFDLILIDGDHNYFTVFNELKLIDFLDLLKKDGLIFFHDVNWPYGFRDMYYQVDTIPTHWKHESATGGIETKDGKFHNSEFNNAKVEGTEKNGVKCAIVDWLSIKPAQDYEYLQIDEEYGLGILTKKKTTLTDLAVKYDSDKFGGHDYTRIFEEKFLPLKNNPISLLEIGIFHGASLKMWEEYFKHGHIYGLDIVDKSEFNTDRITTLLGSQNDVEFLNKVGNTIHRPIDIIIDDGSHINSDVITSFKALFKYVSPLNGLYIIEDTQTSYWPEFGGKIPSTKETILGFFTELAEDLNYSETPGAPYPYFPESTMIKSIEFSHNLIIITKAPNCYPSNIIYDEFQETELPLLTLIEKIKK